VIIHHLKKYHDFIGINKSPNVYAIETTEAVDIILNNDIQFERENITYMLENCTIYNTNKSNVILIECSKWNEKYH